MEHYRIEGGNGARFTLFNLLVLGLLTFSKAPNSDAGVGLRNISTPICRREDHPTFFASQ